MSKSIAILGLGKYGRSLAENLYHMGADVLVADRNPELVQDYADKVTTSLCVDLNDENELHQLGLGNMDIVVVAMGEDLAPSILSVYVAKEEGVPFVLAKASSQSMATLLKKVGADKVIDPEEESGFRSARILLSSSFIDFFQMDNNLGIVELNPRPEWVGKTLKELDLRKKHDINIIAVRRGGVWTTPSPDRPIQEDERILLVALQETLKTFN